MYIGGDFNARVGNLNQLSNEIILSNKCGSSKSWFDEECVKLKKLLKNCLRIYKYNRFEDKNLILNYNEKRNEYKRLLAIKKDQYNESLLSKLSVVRDSISFWKIVNGFRYHSPNINVVSLKE